MSKNYWANGNLTRTAANGNLTRTAANGNLTSGYTMLHKKLNFFSKSHEVSFYDVVVFILFN